MDPFKMLQNKTTRGIFKMGALSITVKRGGPRLLPRSPDPISTTGYVVPIIQYYYMPLKRLRHKQQLKILKNVKLTIDFCG